MTLGETLSRHLPVDSKEAADLRTIVEFVSRHQRPFDRQIREGHLTGSAFVVSADGERVLLLHHRLQCWLQPGGHGDPGERRRAMALREAVEETSLDDLGLHPSAPAWTWTFLIPARPGEPAHHHLDLRYLFVAHNSGPCAARNESTTCVSSPGTTSALALDLIWSGAAQPEPSVAGPSVRGASRLRHRLPLGDRLQAELWVSDGRAHRRRSALSWL